MVKIGRRLSPEFNTDPRPSKQQKTAPTHPPYIPSSPSPSKPVKSPKPFPPSFTEVDSFVKREPDEGHPGSQDVIDRQEAQPVLSLEARFRDLEKERIKLKGHNLRLEAHFFTLTNRLAEARSKLEDYHDRFNGPTIGESELKELKTTLKARLEAQLLQKCEFGGLKIDRLGFQEISFRERAKQLFSTIDDTSCMIFHFMTIDDSLPKQRSGFDQLGQTWVTSFYGGDLGALLDYSDKAEVCKKKLLAALLTAGVFELVLKPVFPSILTPESPLLDEYRKHILTQGKCNICSKISTDKQNRWMARTAEDRLCCHKISYVRLSPQDNIHFRKGELVKFTNPTYSKLLLSLWKK